MELSWLLSTLAQSSAALVAIIGGLLASRYVSLHAEQQAAERRIGDLERRHKETQRRRAEAQKESDDRSITKFYSDYDVLERTWEASQRDEFPSMDSLVQTFGEDTSTLPVKLLEEHLPSVQSELKKAVKELDGMVPAGDDHPSWEEYRRSRGLSPTQTHLWEWAYDRVCDNREAAVPPRPFMHHPLSVRRLVPANTAEIQVDADYGKRLSELIRGLTSKESAQEEEIALAAEALEAARQPQGFNLALRVLTVVAILGIVLPVLILTASPVALLLWADIALRGTSLLAFVIGLFILLRFLFVYSAYLRGRRADLPLRVWGLLRRSSSDSPVNAEDAS